VGYENTVTRLENVRAYFRETAADGDGVDKQFCAHQVKAFKEKEHNNKTQWVYNHLGDPG